MKKLLPALSMALVMCASAAVAVQEAPEVAWPPPHVDRPTDPRSEVRNVRLDVHVVQEVDSVFFSLRWVPPPRGRLQTPITGYAWEVWRSDGADVNPEGPVDTLVVSGVEPEDARSVQTGVPFSCTEPSFWYAGRVRALGNFSSPAPWAQSDSIEVACDDSPPGPPTIDFDTIPPDTTLLLGLLEEGPDTISFEEPWILMVADSEASCDRLTEEGHTMVALPAGSANLCGEHRTACAFLLADGAVLARSGLDCVSERAFGVASSEVPVVPVDWCSHNPAVLQIDGETEPCGAEGPQFNDDLLRRALQ